MARRAAARVPEGMAGLGLLRPARRNRAGRRHDPEATLADAVAGHVAAGNGSAYEVNVRALVERLRGLGTVRLAAVVDFVEQMNAAGLRDDFEARERVREEFGITG
jgi:hypothetical protein